MHKETISPTDLALWRLCARKDWYVNGPLRLPLPTSTALTLGIAFHAKMEAWYKRQPEPGAGDIVGVSHEEALRIDTLASDMVEALLNSPHLPHRDTPGLQSETWLPRTFGGHTGKMDVLLPLTSAQGIVDFKTCSDKRWAKNVEQLKTDPQAIIYCKQSGRLVFSHLYVLTKRPHTVWMVTVTFTQEELDAAYAAIPRETILLHRQSPDGEGVPNGAAHGACEKWGGCPFKAKCAASGIPSMGFLSSMMQRSGSIEPIPVHDRTKEIVLMAFQKTQTHTKQSALTNTATPTSEEAAPKKLRRRVELPAAPPVSESVSDDDIDSLIGINGSVPAPAPVIDEDEDEDEEERELRALIEKKKAAKAAAAAAAQKAAFDAEQAAKAAAATAKLKAIADAAKAKEAEAEAEVEDDEDDDDDETPAENNGQLGGARRGRGRPKGSPNKAKLPPAYMTPDMEDMEGFMLYIDCMPSVPFIRLESLLDVLGKEVAAAAEAKEIPSSMPRHYLALDYAVGSKRIAALLHASRHTLRGHVVCDRRNPSTGPCIEVLLPMALGVVYGF